MRLSWLFTIMGSAAATLIALTAPRSTEALSCDDDHDLGGGFKRPDAVPVDAHPWLRLDCDDEPVECSFVAEDHTIAAEVSQSNECPEWRVEGHLVEFAPQMPLLPGSTYNLECSGVSEFFDATLTTRASDAPSAPPGEVLLREAWLDRESDIGCGPATPLRLSLDALDALYLLEGGRIEVDYLDGRIIPIAADFVTYHEALPATKGPIALTPVAADGTRGETVRTGELRFREAVYIPCSISGEHSPWALCLIVPVLGIGVANRRRRRAR